MNSNESPTREFYDSTSSEERSIIHIREARPPQSPTYYTGENSLLGNSDLAVIEPPKDPKVVQYQVKVIEQLCFTNIFFFSKFKLSISGEFGSPKFHITYKLG